MPVVVLLPDGANAGDVFAFATLQVGFIDRDEHARALLVQFDDHLAVGRSLRQQIILDVTGGPIVVECLKRPCLRIGIERIAEIDERLRRPSLGSRP